MPIWLKKPVTTLHRLSASTEDMHIVYHKSRWQSGHRQVAVKVGCSSWVLLWWGGYQARPSKQEELSQRLPPLEQTACTEAPGWTLQNCAGHSHEAASCWTFVCSTFISVLIWFYFKSIDAKFLSIVELLWLTICHIILWHDYDWNIEFPNSNVRFFVFKLILLY